MATSDRGLGPKVSQTVLYVVSIGPVVIHPGIITGVNADGTVSISSIATNAVTSRTNANFNPNLNVANCWAYPEVL